MIGTIITAIIIGAIIGGLARLAMPGSQNISIVMTIVLGILGSAIGSWLVSAVGYKNSSGGIAWLAVLAGVVVAAILIAIYMSMTGRRV